MVLENKDLDRFFNLLTNNGWPFELVRKIFSENLNRISENIGNRYHKLDLGRNPQNDKSEFKIKLEKNDTIKIKVNFQHPSVEKIIKNLSKYLNKVFPEIFIHFIYLTKNLSSITKKYLKPKIDNQR